MKSLQEFYQAYANWLDTGAPQRKPFCRFSSLANNLVNWNDGDWGLVHEMESQIEEAYEKDYDNYPFLLDSVRHKLEDNGEMHLATRWNKWVKDHAQ